MVLVVLGIIEVVVVVGGFMGGVWVLEWVVGYLDWV